MEFMHLYIEQGRFGEFVTEILLAEKRRKEELSQKEENDRWWDLYLHSYSDKSFIQWKEELTGRREDTVTTTNKEVEDVDSIIKRLFHH